MPSIMLDPNKLNWLAQNFDPAPFASELERVSQMGSNFMTMPGGGTPAPAPGTAGPMTGAGLAPAPNADFASIVAGESGGVPQAGPSPMPLAPLPAGLMQQVMQQPQAPAPRAPAAAPQKGRAPNLPGVPRANPVMDLGSILFGKRGF